MDWFPLLNSLRIAAISTAATFFAGILAAYYIKGLFTRDRRPKLVAHYFRRRWHAIPDFGYKG